MKRTALTLMTLVGLAAFTATTAQAGTAASIASGIVAQTLAKPHHHGGGHHHKAGKHHGHHGHHNHHGHHWHHGHHHPPVVVWPPRPIVVRPYIHRRPCLSNLGGFYYSGQDFSFGFGF